MRAYKAVKLPISESMYAVRSASRDFQEPEEELVAHALDRMGLRWHYETLTLVIESDGRSQSATADFWIELGGDQGLFLEVKRATEKTNSRGKRHKRQRIVALRAGFAFAYFICRPNQTARLCRRLRQAIRRAKKAGRRARRRGSRWRVTVQTNRRLQFVPVSHAVG